MVESVFEPQPTQQTGGETFEIRKGLDVALSPHGLTISLSSTLITTAFAALGAWVATRTGVHFDADTLIGASAIIGAGWKLWDNVQTSNDLTKRALQAKT